MPEREEKLKLSGNGFFLPSYILRMVSPSSLGDANGWTAKEQGMLGDWPKVGHL